MIPPEDEKVIEMVARRYYGLPGVDLDDLKQEGRIAWWTNLKRKQDNPRWPGLLACCVSRAIQKHVLPYSFQIKKEKAELTYKLPEDKEEQVNVVAQRIMDHANMGPKLQKQFNRLKGKGHNITIEQLAKAKARRIIQDVANMKGVLSIEDRHNVS